MPSGTFASAYPSATAKSSQRRSASCHRPWSIRFRRIRAPAKTDPVLSLRQDAMNGRSSAFPNTRNLLKRQSVIPISVSAMRRTWVPQPTQNRRSLLRKADVDAEGSGGPRAHSAPGRALRRASTLRSRQEISPTALTNPIAPPILPAKWHVNRTCPAVDRLDTRHRRVATGAPMPSLSSMTRTSDALPAVIATHTMQVYT
jgi:hypothetical protein